MSENGMPDVDIAAKMREALAAAKGTMSPAPAGEPKAIHSDWGDWVPACESGQFLIEVLADGGALFCVREPTWFEASAVESGSYKLNATDDMYFSGEKERRDLMGLATVWVADRASGKVVHSADSDVLRFLTLEAGEELWSKLSKHLFLSLEEARYLKACATRFFRGEAIGGGPLPPIIVETDALRRGFFAYSRAEYMAIPMSQYERMSLVMATYQECVSAPVKSETAPPELSHQRKHVPTAFIRSVFGKAR